MSGLTRVLVVDDEPAIHRFLTPALVANNYHVLRADTGSEALKRIANDAPDIVVLDLGLPDMDGKDVIGRLREWTDVPIVVLSARDREAEKIAALDRGAEGDYHATGHLPAAVGFSHLGPAVKLNACLRLQRAECLPSVQFAPGEGRCYDPVLLGQERSACQLALRELDCLERLRVSDLSCSPQALSALRENRIPE